MYIHTHIHAYTQTHIQKSLHYMYVHVCGCMYMRVCVCVFVYIYIHTHAHTSFSLRSLCTPLTRQTHGWALRTYGLGACKALCSESGVKGFGLVRVPLQMPQRPLSPTKRRNLEASAIRTRLVYYHKSKHTAAMHGIKDGTTTSNHYGPKFSSRRTCSLGMRASRWDDRCHSSPCWRVLCGTCPSIQGFGGL